VLIVITPHLVRMRDIAKENLHALSVGTDAEMLLRQKNRVTVWQEKSFCNKAET
jgi:hypothetical protein